MTADRREVSRADDAEGAGREPVGTVPPDRPDALADPRAAAHGGPPVTEQPPPDDDRLRAPAIARVRSDDIEPHEGLRHVARLFKTLALFLLVMLAVELVLGFRQQGMAALGPLLIEAMRVIVIAGVLWGLGDIAVILIESNHDLRAVRILLGRLNGKMDRALRAQPPDIAGRGAARGAPPEG
jgi:hypothetical protein